MKSNVKSRKKYKLGIIRFIANQKNKAISKYETIHPGPLGRQDFHAEFCERKNFYSSGRMFILTKFFRANAKAKRNEGQMLPKKI